MKHRKHKHRRKCHDPCCPKYEINKVKCVDNCKCVKPKYKQDQCGVDTKCLKPTPTPDCIVPPMVFTLPQQGTVPDPVYFTWMEQIVDAYRQVKQTGSLCGPKPCTLCIKCSQDPCVCNYRFYRYD